MVPPNIVHSPHRSGSDEYPDYAHQQQRMQGHGDERSPPRGGGYPMHSSMYMSHGSGPPPPPHHYVGPDGGNPSGPYSNALSHNGGPPGSVSGGPPPPGGGSSGSKGSVPPGHPSSYPHPSYHPHPSYQTHGPGPGPGPMYGGPGPPNPYGHPHSVHGGPYGGYPPPHHAYGYPHPGGYGPPPGYHGPGGYPMQLPGHSSPRSSGSSSQFKSPKGGSKASSAPSDSPSKEKTSSKVKSEPSGQSPDTNEESPDQKVAQIPAKPSPRKTKEDDDGAVPTADGAMSSVSSVLSGGGGGGASAPRDDDDDEEEEVLSTKVEPMRQDFHFFAMDHKDEHLAAARASIMRRRRGTEGEGKEVEPVLIFTNLNYRLTKAWEDESQQTRAMYMTKEEEDRRRFMNDEDIASRHCATLTARAKSPKAPNTSGRSPGRGLTKREQQHSDIQEEISSSSHTDNSDHKPDSERHAKDPVRDEDEGYSSPRHDKATVKLEPTTSSSGPSSIEATSRAHSDEREHAADKQSTPEKTEGGEFTRKRLSLEIDTGDNDQNEATSAVDMQDADEPHAKALESPSKRSRTDSSEGSPVAGNLTSSSSFSPRGSMTMSEMYGDFQFSASKHGSLSSHELQKLADSIPTTAHASSKNRKRDVARLREEREKFLEAAKGAEEREGEGMVETSKDKTGLAVDSDDPRREDTSSPSETKSSPTNRDSESKHRDHGDRDYVEAESKGRSFPDNAERIEADAGHSEMGQDHARGSDRQSSPHSSQEQKSALTEPVVEAVDKRGHHQDDPVVVDSKGNDNAKRDDGGTDKVAGHQGGDDEKIDSGNEATSGGDIGSNGGRTLRSH